MTRLFIVDDERGIVEALEEFFRKVGYEVITATDGKRALDFIRSGEPVDLMLLDMKMPGCSGVDILREMKRLGRNIRVLIFSGAIELEIGPEELSTLGCSEEDILRKPLDLFKLLNAVKKKLAS